MAKTIKSTTVTARISPEVKQQASEIFEKQYGLSMTAAISLFFHQTIANGRLPFELIGKDPEQKTQNP